MRFEKVKLISSVCLVHVNHWPTNVCYTNWPEALDDLSVQVTALDTPHLPRLHPQQLNHSYAPQIQATVRLLDVSHKKIQLYSIHSIHLCLYRSQQGDMVLTINKTPINTFDLRHRLYKLARDSFRWSVDMAHSISNNLLNESTLRVHSCLSYAVKKEIGLSDSLVR